MFVPSCNPCPSGKYSLIDPYKSKLCQSCPKNALCDGGSNIRPNAGFWKESNEIDIILDCLQFSQFCL